MKLASKYNRANILTCSVILLFTGFVYYTVIHSILTNKLDKDLAIEEEEIIHYATAYKKLPLPADYMDQRVSYRAVLDGRKPERKFLNSIYDNPDHPGLEPGRSLLTSVSLDGRIFQITIEKSRVQSEELMKIIFLITIGIMIVLLVSISIINRVMLGRIWKPFYKTLHQMKSFNLTDETLCSPVDTQIDEFQELNEAAVSMCFKAKKDYGDLKSFTDNASHEMMTPLSIINSKLDTLIQIKPLDEEQGGLLDDIYDSLGRLSRLNHSLLLLTKLENNLIKEQESIDLKAAVSSTLRQFQELIEAKNITLMFEGSDKHIRMSKYLLDTLLNNLISNAIRHTQKGGEISVQLHENEMRFANTGLSDPLDPVKIFERFNKNSSSEGVGLGLAIARQICEINNFSINYEYASGQHIFIITF